MRSRGVLVVVLVALGVVALIASLRFVPRDETEVYFHRGSGELVVTGGRTETLTLRNPRNDIYGVAYLPSSRTRTVYLDFAIAGNHGLSLAIENFAGAGEYPVAQTTGEVGDATVALGDEAYRCYSRCRACTVTVDSASRASISGSVACSSMINCAAARLVGDLPVPGDLEPCKHPPSSIDIAGTFLLDDPTDKRRDR